MPTTLTYITESIAQFTVGVFQEFVLEASGGTPPYVFQIMQGNLPQGLNFSASGKISGTPTSPGTSTPFFKVTDSAGDHLTQAMEVTVAEGEADSTPSTLTFITESIPMFTVGVFREFDLEASGGTPPYAFEITQGNLPAGLNFDNSGKISGTADSPGTSTVYFKVTDSAEDDLTQAMEVSVTDSTESADGAVA
ncbi:MAG TPA: putative Ig domain-containing protein [Pyrinomonadaceae bacterium]